LSNIRQRKARKKEGRRAYSKLELSFIAIAMAKTEHGGTHHEIQAEKSSAN
jgi:hypothetical protein